MCNDLYHHGILGMRCGIRRYQNKDGSLTPEGRKRLDLDDVQKNMLLKINICSGGEKQCIQDL